MKLTFFRGEEPNFGDELNTLMWKHLVPNGFFDQDEDELFLGIGSIIWDYLPRAALKHVMGSGYGGYTAPPNVKDGNWNVVWVRGPLTARTLGIDERLAIADSAILLRTIPLPEPEEGVGIAFMPHFHSIRGGDWETVCNMAGITYLDPTECPHKLISKIRGARLVLTEAMHGAIVADALRTPFIPFIPLRAENRMKWQDWASSLSLTLEQHALPLTTLHDFYVSVTNAKGTGTRSMKLRSHPLAKPANNALTSRAAEKISLIANKVSPVLSKESRICEATEKCQEALEKFIHSRS